MFTNRKKLKLQGKTHAHRKSIMKSQVIELIRAKRIRTTPKKAKALKSTFDRLVTNAKKKSNAGDRVIEAFFNGVDRSRERFFEVVQENLNDRNSGYTRIIRTLPRKGDGAEQVFVMLMNSEVTEKKSKLKKLMEKEEKKANAKKEGSFGGKISKAIGRGANPKVSSGPVSKEKTAHTQRNSK